MISNKGGGGGGPYSACARDNVWQNCKIVKLYKIETNGRIFSPPHPI